MQLQLTMSAKRTALLPARKHLTCLLCLRLLATSLSYPVAGVPHRWHQQDWYAGLAHHHENTRVP